MIRNTQNQMKDETMKSTLETKRELEAYRDRTIKAINSIMLRADACGHLSIKDSGQRAGLNSALIVILEDIHDIQRLIESDV